MASKVFKQYLGEEKKLSPIFALIPAELKAKVLAVSAKEKKSIYQIVIVALRMFFDEYEKSQARGSK